MLVGATVTAIARVEIAKGTKKPLTGYAEKATPPA